MFILLCVHWKVIFCHVGRQQSRAKLLFYRAFMELIKLGVVQDKVRILIQLNLIEAQKVAHSLKMLYHGPKICIVILAQRVRPNMIRHEATNRAQTKGWKRKQRCAIGASASFSSKILIDISQNKISTSLALAPSSFPRSIKKQWQPCSDHPLPPYGGSSSSPAAPSPPSPLSDHPLPA